VTAAFLEGVKEGATSSVNLPLRQKFCQSTPNHIHERQKGYAY